MNMSTSLIHTDGYKFSMAEAGWPLRRETFYYCHRRGGGSQRDRVAAVYKLSQTGGTPTMKFGDEPTSMGEDAAGKASVPGSPVTFRRLSASGPIGIIGQLGERPPDGYCQLTDAPSVRTGPPNAERGEVVPSEETRALVDALSATHRG